MCAARSTRVPGSEATMNEWVAMRCFGCGKHKPLYILYDNDEAGGGWGEFYCKRCVVEIGGDE